MDGLAAQWAERAHRFAEGREETHAQLPVALSTPTWTIHPRKRAQLGVLLRSTGGCMTACPCQSAAAACILTPERSRAGGGVGSPGICRPIADRGTLRQLSRHGHGLCAIAYGMAGHPGYSRHGRQNSTSICSDPFSSFGPVNLVDLGLVDRDACLTALMDEDITGPQGRFPTNLSGGLLARGHPLGATGMVQVVENHQMLVGTPEYQVALSHSIGGPINNNVVTLLEKSEHYEATQRGAFKPTRCRCWLRRARGMTLETLFAERERIKARFHCCHDRASTAKANPSSRSCCTGVIGTTTHEFLIGTGPDEYEGNQPHAPRTGDSSCQERRGSDDRRSTGQRLHRKTVEGIVRLPTRPGTAGPTQGAVCSGELNAGGVGRKLAPGLIQASLTAPIASAREQGRSMASYLLLRRPRRRRNVRSSTAGAARPGLHRPPGDYRYAAGPHCRIDASSGTLGPVPRHASGLRPSDPPWGSRPRSRQVGVSDEQPRASG